MISQYVIKSAGATHDYHRDAFDLARNTAEGIANESIYATWGGKGAEYAGLTPGSRVTSEPFLAALEGKFINPATQQVQHIGGYRKDAESGDSVWKHPPGLELVFSGPKSFSMMALTGGDDRLLAAHDLALARTMDYAERAGAIAKVSVQGQKIDKPTGTLAWAAFPHETSRHNDEQLHTHVVVANATYDTESQQWRGLNNHKLLGMVASTELDQVYMAELRGMVESLGYKTVESEHSAKTGGWEIAGFSRDLIEEASRSTKAADKSMRDNGQDYQTAGRKERQFAHYDSRPEKSRIARPELLASWQERTDRHGLDLADMRETAMHYAKPMDAGVSANAARLHLADTLAESNGKVMLPSQVIAETMTRASGQTTLRDVQRAYHDALNSGALHKLEHNGMVSTSEKAANTITRSAEPDHVTAAMRKTGQRVAKAHGLEVPKSEDPKVWRAFLNEHGDKRMGAPKEAAPSKRQLEQQATIDGAMDKVLGELRHQAGRVTETKDALEAAKAVWFTRPDTLAALEKDHEAAKAAGGMFTTRQLGEKLMQAMPELKPFEANRAVERALEAGKLYGTEIQKKDTPQHDQSKYVENQREKLDKFDAKQAQARSEWEAAGRQNPEAFEAKQKYEREAFVARQDTLRDRYEARNNTGSYVKLSVVDRAAPAEAALKETLSQLRATVAAGKDAQNDLRSDVARAD